MSEEQQLLRRAAVTLAIEARPPHGIVFVERAAHLRHHPGEIAFPGGSLDERDGGSLVRAALRELHEEIGVGPERVQIIGQLPRVTPRVTRFVVTPFVAIIEPSTYVLDPSEIAGLFTIPLAEVLERGVDDGVVHVGAFRVKTPVFNHGHYRIWGMTGRILREFVDSWKAESKLRASLETFLYPSA